MGKLSDLIYKGTGINLRLDELSDDRTAQMMVAGVLAVAAHSDGVTTSSEINRMVELMREKYPLKSSEALDLITRGVETYADQDSLRSLFSELNDRLPLAHKEELVVMVLEVLAADGMKKPQELSWLEEALEALGVPDEIMNNVYGKYFSQRRR